MQVMMANAKHTEHLVASASGIVFADSAHVRRFMHSETKYMRCMVIFLRGRFGAGMGM